MIQLRFPPHPDARRPRSWFGHLSHRLGDLLTFSDKDLTPGVESYEITWKKMK
jgi:hypothetical protein